MTTLAANVSLPPWADDLRRRYLRGEASQFVVYGNVHDLVLHENKLYTLSEFICDVLLARSKDTIAVYNVSTGVRFTKRKVSLEDADDLVISKDPAKVLPLLERVLTTNDKIGVLLEYADTIAPAGDTSFSTVDDRAACVTLHRWSVLRALENADSIVILTVESLTELHPKIVSNPRVATVRVPIPTISERTSLIRFLDDSLSDADVARYAEVTAGLKLMQIRAILAPTETAPGADPKAEREERRKYLIELLSSGKTPPSADTLERADKLAAMTQGMTKEAIRKLIAPEGKPPAASPDARIEVDRLIAARKREILERECFGLIEFVTPGHGFDVVGGMEEVKKDLLQIADNIRQGRRNRSPMGLLFTGPMGTGKTFVAEAFARECGLTTIKLKNFRSKWVGATEGNLEKILSVVQAIGQIIVIIDEGDRAFGNSEGEGDGGTSSRVIGRIKEFMSDTDNRGRVLFILMTNRPDKLDVDIKRAGRLDRKIPFFYPQTAHEVSNVLAAQLRKNKVKSELNLVTAPGAPGDLPLCEPLVGYSNADIEAIVLLAADYAASRHPDASVTAEDFKRATTDYLPSRDVAMIEYMELLAVFEASNRRMLPKKYADLSVEALQAKVAELRLRVGARR